MLSVRTQRLSARLARGLEPNAPIAPLWRTPLVTSVDTSGHGPLGSKSLHPTLGREFPAERTGDKETSGWPADSSTRCCDSADWSASVPSVQPEVQNRESSRPKENLPPDSPPNLPFRRGYPESLFTRSFSRVPPWVLPKRAPGSVIFIQILHQLLRTVTFCRATLSLPTEHHFLQIAGVVGQTT